MAAPTEDPMNRLMHELLDLRETMTSQIAAVRSDVRELLGHFDVFAARFAGLEAEYHSLAAGVARIESLLGSRTRDASVQEQIRQLQEKLVELQRRVDELSSAS